MDINKKTYDYINKLRPTLDKENKFMFFEVKKAGTNSVRRGALKKRSIIYKDIKKGYDDIFKVYSLNDIDNMFKFVIVRNPYDRVVSAFFYLQKIRKLSRNFNFKKFIKTKFKDKGPSINEHFHRMKRKVCFEEKGFVDFIGKLENINNDWQIISKNIEGPENLPHINKGKFSNYKQYYDNECKEIVSKIYEEDLEYFKYKF